MMSPAFHLAQLVSIRTRLVNRVRPWSANAQTKAEAVSIRTRLVNRVRPVSCDRYDYNQGVSIRTRLVNRVRRLQRCPKILPRICFNPHPAGEPGETQRKRASL